MPHLRHISPLTLRLLTQAITLLSLCLNSCTPVREAQQIVAEADSLRTVGVQYTDSTAMADAAATLEHVHLIYPTAYAHASYYYGRILRAHDNHPEAMLAFLRVIHSRTEDNEIKARAYSNMGTLCHKANEYELACNMYSLCAEEFLLIGDSTMYYYALNEVALNLAENKQTNRSMSLTQRIESECSDKGVLAKLWETRAEAYIQIEEFDSTLFCIKQLHALGDKGATGFALLARAYENLNVIDSALFYAKKVVNESNFYGDKFNMLYVLSHYDTTLSTNYILTLTSNREDIRFEEYEPEKVMLTQAVQLLQQDLNRKPDLKWLLAVVITLVAIGTTLTLYVKRKRRQHQLYSQRVAKAQEEHRNLSEQNTQLEQTLTQHQKKVLAEIEVFCNSITKENLKQELCWRDFDKMCTIVNSRMYGLVDKLRARGITSDNEIRICVVVIIGHFDTKQMVDIVSTSYDSFKTTKSFAAKKLKTTGKNMRTALLKVAIGG